MSTKHKNPYRAGTAYNKVFGAWQKSQVATKDQLLNAKVGTGHDITVVLSPRAKGKTREGADCRGSFSAKGHLYFSEPLEHAKGDPKKFRLRWRDKAMEPRKRGEVTAVAAKKVKKVVKSPKAPAKKAPQATEAKATEVQATEAVQA